MKLSFASLIILLLSFEVNSQNSQPVSSTSLPPVETTVRAGLDQKPAFTGQTRVAGAKTTTLLSITSVATTLNKAWGFCFLPDGRMIVSEREGNIRIVTATGQTGVSILNVPPVRNKGDGGLMDLQIDPDFSQTRLVFWSYMEEVDGKGINCVARGRLSADEKSFEQVKVIYRGTSPYEGVLHNGSRMLFDKNGLLYVTFGCRYDEEIRKEAQVLSSSLGKIIRITKDGAPAKGNPFLKKPGTLPEIFSYGHRNPQGLAFHPVTGALWGSDHGPQGGDEINIIKPGANYGWPVISYGLEYSNAKVGTGTQQPGMEQPIYYWDPSIAPSGMTFYTGALIPEWKNNLLVAALRGSHISRLIIKNNRVIGEERLLESEKQRLRHIVQGPDGALYVITAEANALIFRIAAK